MDGILRELDVKWLRSQIGLASQEPIPFSTTIRNNVTHGLVGTKWENASKEKFTSIEEACVKANADGFISKLPDGYETPAGECGFLMSGGRGQRVATARTTASDLRIVLLDGRAKCLGLGIQRHASVMFLANDFNFLFQDVLLSPLLTVFLPSRMPTTLAL